MRSRPWMWLCGVMAVGCGPSTATCVPGQSAACACTNGAAGAQVCGADGHFLACICEVDAATPHDAATPGDAGVDAATRVDAAMPDDAVMPDDAATSSDAGTDAWEPADAASYDAGPATIYANGFEGACPAAWTLTGDWECGVPANVGPSAAFEGTQCIATRIAGNYGNLQTFAGTTATSPDIDLASASAPRLRFQMWIDTEGSVYDGVSLSVSDDGGATYTVLTAVSPAYSLTIAGQPAWGGHQGPLGWQPVVADLSAYAGRTIRLRFAFRSDTSGTYPGVYVDDLVVESP